MSENINDTKVEKNKYSKNDGKFRSKGMTAIFGFVFGACGFHRFCMGKKDFFRYAILIFILAGIFVECGINEEYDGLILFIPIILVYIESIGYIVMSNKRFNMLCEARKISVEFKILFMSYDKLDTYANEIGMTLNDKVISEDDKVKRTIKEDEVAIPSPQVPCKIQIEVVDNTKQIEKDIINEINKNEINNNEN